TGHPSRRRPRSSGARRRVGTGSWVSRRQAPSPPNPEWRMAICCWRGSVPSRWRRDEGGGGMKRGSVTWQLTLAEVGRLGRSPYPWAAVFATLALLTGLTWDQAPNLAAAAVNAEAATFVVAATVMLLANPATLRDQRPGVPEMLAALPSPAEVR